MSKIVNYQALTPATYMCIKNLAPENMQPQIGTYEINNASEKSLPYKKWAKEKCYQVPKHPQTAVNSQSCALHALAPRHRALIKQRV